MYVPAPGGTHVHTHTQTQATELQDNDADSEAGVWFSSSPEAQRQGTNLLGRKNWTTQAPGLHVAKVSRLHPCKSVVIADSPHLPDDLPPAHKIWAQGQEGEGFVQLPESGPPTAGLACRGFTVSPPGESRVFEFVLLQHPEDPSPGTTWHSAASYCCAPPQTLRGSF